MNGELHRGNVVLLKRALADFICVVKQVDGEKVRVRYMDSPPEDEGVVVKTGDLIKLAEQQEKELPHNFVEAIERQRQVVFAPKKERRQGVGKAMKDVSDDTFAEILKILQEDGGGEEDA